MNKVFKIIWNKTTQSFVVTSELAKGAVKASSNSEQRVTSETRLSSLFKLSAFALSLSAVMMPAQAQVIVGDGSNAPTNVHPFSIAVGNSATSASGGSTTAIGYGVNGRYDNSVLIGDGTGNYGGTTGSRNILIGQNAQVGDSTSVVRVNQSIAIGAGIRADKAATFGVILLLRGHGLEAINQLRLAVMLFLMVMHRLRLVGMILIKQRLHKRLISILMAKIKRERFNKHLKI